MIGNNIIKIGEARGTGFDIRNRTFREIQHYRRRRAKAELSDVQTILKQY